MATRGRATVLTQSGWPTCWRAPRTVTEGVCVCAPKLLCGITALSIPILEQEMSFSDCTRVAPAQVAQSRGKLRAIPVPSKFDPSKFDCTVIALFSNSSNSTK